MSTQVQVASQPVGAPDPAIAREVRRLVRFSAALVIVLFGIVGLWAALAELYGAVVAPGVLKVEANLKLVQHNEGGVVRSIFIKEGQRVAIGDPLIELEDIEANASMAMTRDQLDADLARQARLTAEIRNAPRIDFPAELLQRRASPGVQVLIGNEESLFAARLRLLREQTSKMREQRRAVLAEIESLGRQIAAAEKSLGHLNEQQKMNESLHEQNFVSNSRVLDAKRSTAEKEEKKFEFESLQAQARQKLADLEMRLESLESGRLAENSKDLVDAQSRIANLRERLKPAKDVLERRIIRAPSAGTVNVLKANTQGGVIAPRETIAEIVPDQSQLVAEVRINPADMDDLQVGQEVEIELSGLNRRATPLLPGKLGFVSPDLNSDPANPAMKFFVARVVLNAAPPPSVTISSGMPVAAYIRTRKRSPLELWLDPLIGGIRKSMRET
jgi:HlyD family type I secretion membrane fusion protein